MNRSKVERDRPPTKPDFSWGSVAAGLFVGMLAGMLWKHARGGHGMVIMQCGALAGLLPGLSVAARRFYRDRRRYCEAFAGIQRSRFCGHAIPR